MVYIIATSKIWNPHLLNNLQNRTTKRFLAVTDHTQLTEHFLSDIKPAIIFFPHWSYRIPSAILNHYECIIFHMTDLPFGRGGSPLQNLIERGIYHTKVSALRCEENIDTGPIYLKKPLSLLGRAQDIFYQANQIIEDMIVEIIENKLAPIPQKGEAVTFKRRTPEQSNLAICDELVKTYDYIRMLDADNYPKAFIESEHLTFEFSQPTLKENEIIANVTIKLKRETHVRNNSGDSSTPR